VAHRIGLVVFDLPRRMLAKRLATLAFRCNNAAWRPVIDGLELPGGDLVRRLFDLPGS